uniref:Uncharacterized protein LOC114340330 n=1 Tax=Diabrotica virgifera virgifera TaxID=50390 RepID=A0A6P7GLQ2_DIAVI
MTQVFEATGMLEPPDASGASEQTPTMTQVFEATGMLEPPDASGASEVPVEQPTTSCKYFQLNFFVIHLTRSLPNIYTGVGISHATLSKNILRSHGRDEQSV